MRPYLAAAILAPFLTGCTEKIADPVMTAAELTQEVEQWRRDRVGTLRAPDGWLTLVGLYFLQDGENSFGSGEENVVCLPAGKAPEQAGVFVVQDGKVTVRVASGVEVQADGKPVTEAELAHDGGGVQQPTYLTHGPLTFFPVERGGRIAIRVRDAESETRSGFAGFDYFPISTEWAIPARFERSADARDTAVETSIGQNISLPIGGIFHFEKDGEPYSLELWQEGSEYYVVFGDATNGESTYAGGRFIRIGDLPPDGPFLLNFHHAYNPPCVFTPYATCPRPTKTNRLPIAVEAGEKLYQKDPRP